MKLNRLCLFPVLICISFSCGNISVRIPDKTHLTQAGMDSALNVNDSLFSGSYSVARIKNLLSHFPDSKGYPVVIDSAYMAAVSNGHDSLGTHQVKMLVRLWHDDELLSSDSGQVCKFYSIDSLKAHHTFTGRYKEGMPTYANAYGLQKIAMREQTLLVWALVSIQQDADPTYRLTTVYYTILNNTTILETGIMGRLMTGMDPPGEYKTILASTLSADGKLTMEENEFTGDMDSKKGELKNTQYEYLIHQGYTQLTTKKQDKTKEVKMK